MAKSNHECHQGDRILSLEHKESNMAQDLKDIKDSQKEMLNDIKKMRDDLNAFILTAPHKFATTEQFNKEIEDYVTFKNNINLKIAFISGGWGVIMFIVTFVANKYF